MSHDFFRIPGPAGEDHSWSTSQKQSGEPEAALTAPFTKKLVREKTSQGQGTLSHKTETGVVHNIEVEIMQMTPGIYGEVCLLLKDRAGIFRACLTSKGVGTWKNVKPGDHVLIKKVCCLHQTCHPYATSQYPEDISNIMYYMRAGFCYHVKASLSNEAHLP
jgi:hypothetical protein